jgi:hypothetical protein
MFREASFPPLTHVFVCLRHKPIFEVQDHLRRSPTLSRLWSYNNEADSSSLGCLFPSQVGWLVVWKLHPFDTVL